MLFKCNYLLFLFWFFAIHIFSFEKRLLVNDWKEIKDQRFSSLFFMILHLSLFLISQILHKALMHLFWLHVFNLISSYNMIFWDLLLFEVFNSRYYRAVLRGNNWIFPFAQGCATGFDHLWRSVSLSFHMEWVLSILKRGELEVSGSFYKAELWGRCREGSHISYPKRLIWFGKFLDLCGRNPRIFIHLKIS